MKGLGFGSNSKKKSQVVPVNQNTASWLNLTDDKEAVTDENPSFDVNLLDYMGVDEFAALMKDKTENDYNALWKASRVLAMQVKTSKALLSLSSQLCAGKSKSEVLDKLVQSMKFSLKADHVFIMEFSSTDNALRVTHSDCISASGHCIPRDKGVEGEVFMNGVLRNRAVDSKTSSSLDALLKFNIRHVLCAPIIVNNQPLGVLKAVRGEPTDGAISPRPPSVSDAFGGQEESMIGFTASNVGFVLKYVSSQSAEPRYSRALSPVTGVAADVAISSPVGTVSSTPEPDRYSIDNVIKYLIQSIYKDFGADRVSVFKLNKDRTMLECIISEDIVCLSVPARSGILGHALSTSSVVVSANTKEDSRFNPAVDGKSRYTTQNILCSPIFHVAQGESIGVLQLLNKNNGTGVWTDRDQIRIAEIAQRLAVLFCTKEDLDRYHDEKDLTHSLSLAMQQMLSTSSFSEMIAIAKFCLGNMMHADYIEIFELESSGATVNMRKVRSKPTPVSATGSTDGKAPVDTTKLPEDSEVVTAPKEVLECIRTGDMQMFVPTADRNEFLAGFSPKQATIFPVGSKVFAGSPPRRVLVISRTFTEGGFSTAEKNALSLFVDILGSVVDTFERVITHGEAVEQKNWELNMIIHALKLMHNYVMLLDESGLVCACNRSLDEVIGSGRKLNTRYEKWFNEDQMLLRDDIGSVYNLGVNVHKDCVLMKGGSGNSDEINISYQLCPVNEAGHVLAEGEPPMDSAQIKAVIVVIHRHEDDEDGAKRLREVLASKSRNLALSISGDISTVHGTMTAVAQAICEIGGRFNLGYTEQSAINNMAAMVMQVGRNLRAQMAASSEDSLLPALGTCAEDTRPSEALRTLSSSVNTSCLVTDEARAIKDLFTWDFDVNLYSKATLRGVLGRLFESMLNLTEIQVSPKTLCNFIREAEKHYHENPFHNFYHISCVSHFSYMLINASGGKKLVGDNEYYLFCILLSAVVHDIDHPGNSNLFETNSKSELALLYNEQSVLENHHCSMAFRIMRFHNSDVLADLTPSVYKDVKKTIISCILSTDMSVHFDLIDRVKKKVQVGWNLSDVEDLMFYCRIILHASDLSNPVRCFPLAKLWASRISEEFNAQVEKEKKLGLPVLGFMITPDEKTLCKNEIGFASFVVAPMWRNLEMLFTGFQPLVKQLNDNLDTWKVHLDEFTKAEEQKRSKP